MVLFGLLNLHLQYQKYGRQMILQERIEILNKLSAYMAGNEPEWALAKERAARENPWFAPEFIEKAVNSITNSFLAPPNYWQIGRLNMGFRHNNQHPKKWAS